MASRLSRLQRAAQKDVRLVVGLMSGTSADGIDAALCRIEGNAENVKLALLAHVALPFEPELSQRIQHPGGARELCELNFELGERFADAVLMAIVRAGLRPEDIDLVGSHGQTVAHLPRGLSARPSTLQLGEAAIIAERTGIPVVCDFRPRDMAAGGEGAPLVPYADWALFRKAGVHRALHNLGGISNLSVVGEHLDDTLAFDTGPGNMLLDALARRASGGALTCDLDGQLSRQGQPIPEVLEALLAHPYLHRPPPKSAGREIFGAVLADALWKEHSDRPFDLVATALAYTVETIGRAYETWVLTRFELDAIYLSGGGVRNPALFSALQARLSPVAIRPLDALGIPEQAKEAACFALLASECVCDVSQNVPSATGATRRVVLGKMVP
jgi:anhydro-N-acetylmuramic acid kinase